MIEMRERERERRREKKLIHIHIPMCVYSGVKVNVSVKLKLKILWENKPRVAEVFALFGVKRFANRKKGKTAYSLSTLSMIISFSLSGFAR